MKASVTQAQGTVMRLIFVDWQLLRRGSKRPGNESPGSVYIGRALTLGADDWRRHFAMQTAALNSPKWFELFLENRISAKPATPQLAPKPKTARRLNVFTIST